MRGKREIQIENTLFPRVLGYKRRSGIMEVDITRFKVYHHIHNFMTTRVCFIAQKISARIQDKVWDRNVYHKPKASVKGR